MTDGKYSEKLDALYAGTGAATPNWWSTARADALQTTGEPLVCVRTTAFAFTEIRTTIDTRASGSVRPTASRGFDDMKSAFSP